MDRRQFLKGVGGAGLAAMIPLPALQKLESAGNPILSPELVAREALSMLRNTLHFSGYFGKKGWSLEVGDYMNVEVESAGGELFEVTQVEDVGNGWVRVSATCPYDAAPLSVATSARCPARGQRWQDNPIRLSRELQRPRAPRRIDRLRQSKPRWTRHRRVLK